MMQCIPKLLPSSCFDFALCFGRVLASCFLNIFLLSLFVCFSSAWPPLYNSGWIADALYLNLNNSYIFITCYF
ncbi:hypothetical protein RchiOBHm_Chr3g0496151 [Rosa chinensis]|uniref:Uncharacterized protein n=1 Tax=Rosa chinensis TaxID=74649 RepID=A0A2P6RHE4_ROSCH|nr:hypothetical protein RchiOBHm_Chr3g0496151 [Rosa chinensis]